MSNKPLTPAQQQKIEQQEVQGVTSLLQAPLQYGTDKLLINVNGQSSKLPTNKNGIVKYTLEQPVKLEIGDKVTLIDSFVEERGLSIDTISLEEDVEEEMRFLYYIQGDCRNTQAKPGTAPYTGLGADVQYTHFPNYYPDYYAPKGDINFEKGENGNFFTGFGIDAEAYSGAPSCFPNPNYITTGQSSNASGFGNTDEIFKTTGANGQYYYMGEWWSPFEANDASQPLSWNSFETSNEFNTQSVGSAELFWRPTYGAAVIKIPAGNYSVSALSDLINNQLNGSISRDNTFNSNVLIDKLYKDTSGQGFIQTAPFLTGLTEPQGGEIESPSTYNPDVLIIGEALPTTIMAWNADNSVYNALQSKRENAKAFSTNCFLHLDGMTQLFETDYFLNSNVDNMPSLNDWFLGNIGDEGKFYLNNNLANLHYQPPGASSNIYYWSQIEDLKWSMMFGVGSSSFAGIDGYDFPEGGTGAPQTFAQQMAGTTSFAVSYDTESANRFTITDLHEPYKYYSI